MGRRTNTILQSAFFALNPQILPYEEAVDLMKKAAKKSYGKKGDEVVQLNYKAIDMGKDGLVEVEVDKNWSNLPVSELRKPTGDAYWDEYAARINGLDGYNMPVSSFVKNGVLDGTMQNNIAFKEKRTIAVNVPEWNPDNCIQCGFCSFVCPHATIRIFALTEEEIKDAPMEFKTLPLMGDKSGKNLRFRVQVSQATVLDADCVLLNVQVRRATRLLRWLMLTLSSILTHLLITSTRKLNTRLVCSLRQLLRDLSSRCHILKFLDPAQDAVKLLTTV